MTKPVELIALKCIKCDTSIPAELNEVAWVCEQCGLGQRLGETGLLPLEVHYSKGVEPSKKGRPFWVCEGRVAIDRDTYGLGRKTKDAEKFWRHPRKFIIPAFNYPLKDLTRFGPELLRRPPAIHEGDPAPFLPVNLSPDDVPALAEFIVMALEAERKDKVKKINFKLTLSEPELWILP